MDFVRLKVLFYGGFRIRILLKWNVVLISGIWLYEIFVGDF